MADEKPVQIDYRKDDQPPKRPPWRLIRIILILSAVLPLTLMNLRSPRVSGWIGYLIPVTSLLFICFLVAVEIWTYWRGEDPDSGEFETTQVDQPAGTVRRAYPSNRTFRGSVFSGVEVGCVGATILVVFTVLCAFSLLAMAWWPHLHR